MNTNTSKENLKLGILHEVNGYYVSNEGTKSKPNFHVWIPGITHATCDSAYNDLSLATARCNYLAPHQYIIKTEVLTSDNKRDKSESAQKAMNITANVTKTKAELKDFMIQWQKHKAKDFPAGKVFVTASYKSDISQTCPIVSEAGPNGYTKF